MVLQQPSDEYFMGEALKEAQLALDEGEVPVGAVIVAGGQIIGRAHNQTERLNDATAHAEMISLTSAESYLGSKYLSECTLYVTLEPCVMCIGGTYWTQIKSIVYGASDLKRGYKQAGEHLKHPKTEVKGGILREESEKLLQVFFNKIRKKRD